MLASFRLYQRSRREEVSEVAVGLLRDAMSVVYESGEEGDELGLERCWEELGCG